MEVAIAILVFSVFIVSQSPVPEEKKPILAAEEVPRDKEHIRWTLAQTPHEIRIPFRAEGDVDAHAPAVAHKLLLQIAANAVEHLKFEGLGWNLLGASKGLGGADDVLVVRGQSVISAALHQSLYTL